MGAPNWGIPFPNRDAVAAAALGAPVQSPSLQRAVNISPGHTVVPLGWGLAHPNSFKVGFPSPLWEEAEIFILCSDLW